jgi:hypothetical protein
MYALHFASTLVLLATLLFTSVSAQPRLDRSAPTAQGLIAWWKEVPGLSGGRIWYDLTGRFHATKTNMANEGTSGSAPTSRPGGQGEVRFDGVNDLAIIAASPLLYPPAFSMTFWIRRASSGFSYQGLTSNAAGDQARALFVRLGGGVNISILTTGSTCCYTDFDSGPITANTWHHLAWTYNSQAGMHLWFNCTTDLAALAASGTLWLGINQDLLLGNISPSSANRYTGAMDDVRLYGRALSQGEACTVMRESSQGDPRLLPPPFLGLLAQVLRNPGAFFPFFSP